MAVISVCFCSLPHAKKKGRPQACLDEALLDIILLSMFCNIIGDSARHVPEQIKGILK